MGSIRLIRACRRAICALNAVRSTRTICLPVRQFHSAGPKLASDSSGLFPETFRSVNQSKFSERTHTCDEVTEKDIGREVTLCGWLHMKRMRFIVLRDGFGVTQVLLNETLMKIIEKTPLESVLCVKGSVARRPEGQARQDLPTGQVELVADEVTVLNPCGEVPFQAREYQKKAEALRLKYRYIDLRHKEMQRNLRLRSKLTNAFRSRLVDSYGFCEEQTEVSATDASQKSMMTPNPYLIGGNTNVVPANAGRRERIPRCLSFASSEVLSPRAESQQFKQLLMVGSIDRYFQIARCYRDEGARPDRQPEFTQVDIEMSFVTMENLMNLLEDLVRAVWPISLPPFPRIPYQQALKEYGTDKPDLRYGLLIEDARELLPVVADCLPKGHEVRAIRLPGGSALVKNRHLDDWRKVALQFGLEGVSEVIAREDGTIKSPVKQLINPRKVEKGSVHILAWGPESAVLRTLGKVRTDLARLSGALEGKEEDFKFAWITGFPLFSKDENGKLVSEHHPFTAPYDEDVEVLDSDPLRVRGQHIDLVLNGWEVGGGSIRIHSSCLQEKILKDMLREDSSQLGHLLEALRSGAPPHGGFAFGLDRLISILCNAPSIREVIAFPKTAEGRDLMANAPDALSDEELDYFHLRNLKSEKVECPPVSDE